MAAAGRSALAELSAVAHLDSRAVAADRVPSRGEVFRYFLGLGFVNIGGPVAQLTLMYQGMVERRRWLDHARYVRIMSVCHVLPGPEALQLAIYVGYLTRGVLGGIVAGVTFIVPGALVMLALSALYVGYGSVPAVNDVLYVLKPAVLGIIVAGLLKIGRASLTDLRLGAIALLAFAALRLGGVDLVVVMAVAAALNVLLRLPPTALPRLPLLPVIAVAPAATFALVGVSGWLDLGWMFLRTGLFSFGGAYSSIAFLQRGAVEEQGWVTASQLLDGVALSVATPGPFMLFATFVGYLAGGIAGAVIATVLVFLPSFVLVLVFAQWIERVRERPLVRHALAGVSAAVVAVILTVTLDLAPAALGDPLAAAIALASFVAIVVAARDVAHVALAAMGLGVAFALFRAVGA